jgi:uncharacterized membrane protein
MIPDYYSPSAARAINGAGDVVGWSPVGKHTTPDGTSEVRPYDAFLSKANGLMQDIASPCPCPDKGDIQYYFVCGLAVNGKDQVLVSIQTLKTTKVSFGAVTRGELWQHGSSSQFPSGSFSTAHIRSTMAALSWEPLGRREPTRMGKPYCFGVTICLRGQAAYTQDGRQVVTLPTLPGYTNGSAYRVDDAGDIVGSCNNPQTGRILATLWPKAGRPAGESIDAPPIALGSLLASRLGIDLRYGWLINRQRQIVAGRRLGQHLSKSLARDFPTLAVEAVTGEIGDEVRRVRVDELATHLRGRR